MRSIFCAAAAVAAVFTVSANANAASIGLAGDPTKYLTGGFAITQNGNFNDTWTFDIPSDGIISSLLGSANVSTAGGLTFSSITLNGMPLTLGTDGPNQSFSIYDLPALKGTQTLMVSGSGLGSYSGTVAFSPFSSGGNPQSAVPEPASWALMLGGFGLVGGALRNTRRRNVSLKFV